jgi:hypothetical protein
MKPSTTRTEPNLRRPDRAAMLLAIMLTCLSSLSSAMAQYVASYSYTEDVGTSFHTFYNTEYKFGIGMTNIAYTNVTTGYIFPPNITGLYSTNGCGWDTNGLSTTRQVDTVEQLDTGAFTNGYSGTEMWSGAGPEFPDGYPAISMGYRTANVTLAYVTDGDPTNILSRVYEITVFDAKENGTIAWTPLKPWSTAPTATPRARFIAPGRIATPTLSLSRSPQQRMGITR